MKAKELRIGNFVNHTDDQSTWVMTIETVAAEGCHTECNGIFEYIEPELLEPIPLTEEWLVKFGWGKDDDWDNTYCNNVALEQAVILYNLEYKLFTLKTDRGDEIQIKIKYVHQLQNLYFALTGEELTIKE